MILLDNLVSALVLANLDLVGTSAATARRQPGSVEDCTPRR
jgi:hypothetical protein